MLSFTNLKRKRKNRHDYVMIWLLFNGRKIACSSMRCEPGTETDRMKAECLIYALKEGLIAEEQLTPEMRELVPSYLVGV